MQCVVVVVTFLHHSSAFGVWLTPFFPLNLHWHSIPGDAHTSNETCILITFIGIQKHLFLISFWYQHSTFYLLLPVLCFLAYDSLLCHTALVPLMMMIWSTKCNSDTRYRYRWIELFSYWPCSAPSQHIYSTSQLFLFPFTLLTFWFLSTIFIIRLQSPTMIFFAQRFYSLERLIHCSECRIFYATHFLFLSYW